MKPSHSMLISSCIPNTSMRIAPKKGISTACNQFRMRKKRYIGLFRYSRPFSVPSPVSVPHVHSLLKKGGCFQ